MQLKDELDSLKEIVAKIRTYGSVPQEEALRQAIAVWSKTIDLRMVELQTGRTAR